MPPPGRSGDITIATSRPRVIAIAATCPACGTLQDLISHAPRPVHFASLAVLVALLAGGCVRGWRLGLRVGENGVVVRNFFRTCRFTLAEVSCLTDGSPLGGKARRMMPLAHGLSGDPGGHTGPGYGNGRGWRHAAWGARGSAVALAVSAAATVLLLAEALGVEPWDHVGQHKHDSPAPWLGLALNAAVFTVGAWFIHRRWKKLDRTLLP